MEKKVFIGRERMPNKNEYILEILNTLNALYHKEKLGFKYGRERKETFEEIRKYISEIKNIVLYDYEKRDLLKEIASQM